MTTQLVRRFRADAIGTISVERRSDGDRAWTRTEGGWVVCEPPPRSPDTKDGETEMWFLDAAPPSEKGPVGP